MTEARRLGAPSIKALVSTAAYPTLERVVSGSFDVLASSKRMTVTEAAIAYSRMPAPGGYSRPWSLEQTPYLKEPQDVLTSLDYQGMIFVGPARTGKSVMGLNWLTHTTICDPGDMLYVHMNRDNARKWSKGELERYLMATSEVRRRQLTARRDDNTFDKEFDSGMRFLLTYPTVQNLSAITVGKVWFFDYDRMSDDVDGEGNPFDLGQMRTTTFKRFGMTVAESSPNPSKEITDPKWTPESPHQAPPIRGIFELYNRGDRRRYYWQCPHCGEWFEPDFSLLKWENTKDIIEAAASVQMICPKNGCFIEPSYKDELNMRGRWVPEGMHLDQDGELRNMPGQKRTRSSIASFWLKGPAAGYQSWDRLVEKYLFAQRAYDETLDEGPLRKTFTTDQGSYYVPKSRLSERSPEDMRDKVEFWGSTEEDPTVPEGVLWLVATVDVQATSFVVQVHGFTVAGDMVIVDSFKIRNSERLDAAGQPHIVEPPTYAEDWWLLKSRVLDRTYPLADGSGGRMAIYMTACDSGGREGTTAQAYAFWRALRGGGEHLHRRFVLVKGDASASRPRAATTWPDSHKKDRMAAARGDVPVLLLNSNLLKDQLNAMIARSVGHDVEFEGDETVARGGKLRYPNWMPNWFFKQMTNEVRREKGWVNPASRRNECWDLAYYALGLAVRPREATVPFLNIDIERIDFSDPPAFAKPWAENPYVSLPQRQDANTSLLKPKIEGKKKSLKDIGEGLL